MTLYDSASLHLMPLLSLQLIILREEIDTGPDVLGVRTLGHELKREGVVAGRDSVGAYVESEQ